MVEDWTRTKAQIHRCQEGFKKEEDNCTGELLIAEEIREKEK